MHQQHYVPHVQSDLNYIFIFTILLYANPIFLSHRQLTQNMQIREITINCNAVYVAWLAHRYWVATILHALPIWPVQKFVPHLLRTYTPSAIKHHVRCYICTQNLVYNISFYTRTFETHKEKGFESRSMSKMV